MVVVSKTNNSSSLSLFFMYLRIIYANTFTFVYHVDTFVSHVDHEPNLPVLERLCEW